MSGERFYIFIAILFFSTFSADAYAYADTTEKVSQAAVAIPDKFADKVAEDIIFAVGNALAWWLKVQVSY
ncbi:MAG: gamma-glutamyltranspeptidase/glutathione hydrolase [Psychroserpens sp.]